MLKTKNKRAFTLIELIVVMAVIGVLVLLAIPKFMSYTKEAKFTKFINNIKQLEHASERYYMDHNEWPRLGNDAYTADEIKSFAQKIYDTTGQTISLDESGSYYDIDYNQLSKYISIPDDRTNYIIQNPVGNVYALDGLTDSAKTRLSIPKENVDSSLDNAMPFAVISMTPNTYITTDTDIVWNYNNSTDSNGNEIVAAEWKLNDNPIVSNPNGKITVAGTHIMKLRVLNSKGNWSDWVEKTFIVEQSPVGKVLTSPAPGWKRYESNNSMINYIGSWNIEVHPFIKHSGNSAQYSLTSGDKVMFSFYGSRLNIISVVSKTTSPYPLSGYNIKIDGISYGDISTIGDNFPAHFEGVGTQVVTFQKNDLELKNHTVEMTVLDKSLFNSKRTAFEIDAIEIDEDGYLLTP